MGGQKGPTSLPTRIVVVLTTARGRSAGTVARLGEDELARHLERGADLPELQSAALELGPQRRPGLPATLVREHRGSA